MAITDFLLPKPHGLGARTSSITNAAINGILPIAYPTEMEIDKALSFFNQQRGSELACVYCGDPATEWDHLRPLIKDKKPTGEYTQIRNLVPACGKCNQSKGNKYWKDWMLGSAPLSPRNRSKVGLDLRVKNLEEFEKWGKDIDKANLEKTVGHELWDKYLRALNKIYKSIDEAEVVAIEIKAKTVSFEAKKP
jgi:hypothetical protein